MAKKKDINTNPTTYVLALLALMRGKTTLKEVRELFDKSEELVASNITHYHGDFQKEMVQLQGKVQFALTSLDVETDDAAIYKYALTNAVAQLVSVNDALEGFVNPT